MTADVVAANLGLQLDGLLAASGFKSVTRGPSGLSWQRSFDLTQKLTISILGLLAVGGLGSAPSGLILSAACIAVIAAIWLLRGPQRFQVVLTGHGSGTMIVVADSKHKSALRAVEIFAMSHGGVPVDGLRLLAT